MPDLPVQPLQLYNIAADPGETHDLAMDHPDRLDRMSCELEAWYWDVERDRATIESIWE
jgi:arylsulfatase A-like enzyme